MRWLPHMAPIPTNGSLRRLNRRPMAAYATAALLKPHPYGGQGLRGWSHNSGGNTLKVGSAPDALLIHPDTPRHDMPPAHARPNAFGGSSDETEAAFYDALQRGDIDLLMSCWAEEDDIVCVHPGGPRLLGVAAIRAAFETMFSHGTVRARPVQVRRVVALTSAVHSVVEQVEVMLPDGLHQAVVLATNVYHKTPEGWRLVAHHASPGVSSDAPEVDAQRPVLH